MIKLEGRSRDSIHNESPSQTADKKIYIPGEYNDAHENASNHPSQIVSWSLVARYSVNVERLILRSWTSALRNKHMRLAGFVAKWGYFVRDYCAKLEVNKNSHQNHSRNDYRSFSTCMSIQFALIELVCESSQIYIGKTDLNPLIK
ncbi:unnamed protein product [Thelazia callipaeda]|uniref:Ovule protein n=1 Tax=Thelazia callipaeda TaxID=103827 RepID=A0A0N5D9L3_THECL|nr:unnamed protein product [Thelazia callipaeda]